MNTHGVSGFIPFPRYENAVFVGDTATESLAELKIFAKGLIGGELPNMQFYHPVEKLLECTSCVINDQKVLTTAIRRGEIDYILLENNPASDLNPAVLEEKLRAEGYNVLLQDVSDDPIKNLENAGILMKEEKRAERAIKEFKVKEAYLTGLSKPAEHSVLALLAIRHPVDGREFVFALSDASEVSRGVFRYISATNPVSERNHQTVIPGLVEADDLAPFLETNPDWVALTGDSLALQRALSAYQRNGGKEIKALTKNRVFSVPYYCSPLSVRRPWILERWREAAEAAAD